MSGTAAHRITSHMKVKGIICFQGKEESRHTWVEMIEALSVHSVLLCKQKNVEHTSYIKAFLVESRYIQLHITKIVLIVSSIFCPDTLTKPDTVTTAHLASSTQPLRLA